MLLDIILILIYLSAIMFMALRSGREKDASVEGFFLSSRQLRWPSIAISTIATNIHGYQFLGMMGSAYLYGLAQANLEINAINGILLAAFLFVPMYLKDRVITVTQFIKTRLGKGVALAYSLANIALFSTLGLGSALFLGAYTVEIAFAPQLAVLGTLEANNAFGELLLSLVGTPYARIGTLIIFFGLFSATYTYFGGLAAVVRTDIIQFVVLVVGAVILLFVSVAELGGWDQLYKKTPELMHLHLPADHPKLPWIAIGGMFLLNINYWCANQAVLQRSLAARSLKDAQIGLMVGGVMKYFMAVLIIVPGIALAGIMGDAGLEDPDQTFPYLVTHYLPTGLRGLILCALFASLMSTADSMYNSLATLWSIDIYKPYIKPDATDSEMVRAGRRTILVVLVTSICMGWLLLHMKFENIGGAFTHTLNELRYYINCGIVVIISSAAMLLAPKQKVAIAAFLLTIPLHLLLQWIFPEMNYIVRAMWVILAGFTVIAVWSKGFRKNSFVSESKQLTLVGWGLLASLGLLHFIFH